MRLSLLSCVALAACASAGTSSSAPAPSSSVVRVMSASGTASANLAGNDGITQQKVAAAPDVVFKMLPGILDSLGIPINTLDGAKRTIGNSGFAARGKLKGVSLSRYLDCGGASQMGPNADSYAITIQFIVDVHPVDGGSTLVTALQASGKPLNYAQDISMCNTKGNLEARVAEMVKAKVAGAH